MDNVKSKTGETTLAVDLSEATDAVKQGNFDHALSLLKFILQDDPEHLDGLYLSAVSSRYLKNFEDSDNYLKRLLTVAPDMGRAYQELGHLNRDLGKEEQAVTHYRQACELNPALIASWNYLFQYFVKHKNKPAAEHAELQIKKLNSLPANLLYIDQILNEGRLGMAESKCRAFLKENPTHTYAMSLLAEIANRMGYFDDAEFLLQKLLSFLQMMAN